MIPQKIELTTSVMNGYEFGTEVKIQVVRDAFKTTLANTTVQVKHGFVNSIPLVLQAGGNGGVVYQSPTLNDNGSLYLRSTTDNNDVVLVLI